MTQRIQGCLLAGAAGDALGYGVEFVSNAQIIQKYGPHGLQHYELRHGKAEVSDDTQMTLFQAAGLVLAHQQGLGWVEGTRLAFQDWLQTQSESAPALLGHTPLMRERVLYQRQAPGSTCLSALRLGGHGSLQQPINHSKGCGGVMRVAPVGLIFPATEPLETVAGLAAETAALTHGHPLGWLSAAAHALLIHLLRHGVSWEEALSRMEGQLRSQFAQWPETQALVALLQKTQQLAQEDLPATEAISQLGEGWVGEEALAIGLYAALKSPENLPQALCISINHSGDSDSTGILTGQLLGVTLGEQALPEDWAKPLDVLALLRDMGHHLAQLAQELAS